MRKYRESGKNEMDSQRDLLDSLMGINRNNDRLSEQVSDYRDERVCKYFITGMCPHDIFVNTKMDEGPCEKIHSEALKAAYERSGDLHQFDSIIERHFMSRINEADRVIKRARARVEEEKVDETLNPDINPDIIRIHTAMSKVIAEAEAAGDLGDIDTAQDLILTKLESLQAEKNMFMSRINELRKQKTGINNDKKLRVCDVCGSFLSLYDSDKRLTDHFMGKQHIGFQFMRDSLAAIKERRDGERRLKELERGDTSKERSPRERSREQGEIVSGTSGSSNNNGGGGYADSRRRGRESSRGRDRDRDREDYGSNRRDYYSDRGAAAGGSRGSDFRRRDNSRDRYHDNRDRR